MDNFAVYDTKVGFLIIRYQDESVTMIKKITKDTVDDFGKKTPFTDMVYEELSQYFEGKRKNFTFAYTLYGTDFQKKVWSALLTIPYGETCTYKDIAIQIGNEKASRAVGLANNKNPINIVIPCHRVVGSSGKLVGYAGGLDMKKALLDIEKLAK